MTIRLQANFIKTTGRSRHHIFYKPKVLLPANKKALHATEDYINGLLFCVRYAFIVTKNFLRGRAPHL